MRLAAELIAMLSTIDRSALAGVTGGAANETHVKTPDKTIDRSQTDAAYLQDFVRKACVDQSRDLFNRKDRDPAVAAACQAQFFQQNPGAAERPAEGP